MAASAPKSRTRAIAAKPAATATATYPASPPTVSPDANSPALLPASALGELFIDQSRLLLGHTQQQQQQQQQQHLNDVFPGGSPPQLMSSAGAGTFMLASTTQPLLAGGAASPAWSASSASLNGDIVAAAPLHPATYYSPSTGSSSGMLLDSAAHEWLAASCSAAGVSHEIMFPGLAHLPAAVPSSLTTAAAAANDAAVLDGWLQQFVNAEAIEGVDRHPRALSMDSGGFLFGGEASGSLCPESLAANDTPASLEVALGSPHSVHSSPLGVTACAAIDLLNETEVAAIASAAAGALSSDVLASMISSAASYCPPRDNSSASEMSMLAALPFTAITTTMASIAPQKTLAMAAASLEPPSKKQRRPSPTRKTLGAADAENGSGCPPVCSAGSSKGGVRNTAASTAPSASVNHSRPRPAGDSSASSSSVSPSPPPPPARTKAAAAARHMVPLAPRQPSPSSENAVSAAAKSNELAAKEGTVAAASSAQSSSSGSNTPPGLSVLAKIAQKQEPIQVKAEDSQPALRPIAQACSPQSRSKVVNGTSADGALEKGDCSTLLAAAAAVVALPSTGETVAQKRQERLIKNRAAALLSRKRKRDYMTKLETEVEELRESNMSLARRLEEMELRLSALAAERDELRRENASAKVAAPQPSGHSTTSSASKASEGNKATGGEAAGNSGSESPSSQAAEKPNDAMEVDGDGVGIQSALSLLGADGISAKTTRLATRTIKPRVLLPASAPKPRQPESQQQGSSSKQRTTGALLMAVLFSFSLFTLPSLYTSDNQIAAGGSQSAGMLPIHALPPSAAEQRLLISDALEQQQRDLHPGDAANGGEHAAVAGSPLLERVRRSISELAQQVDDAQAQSPGNSSGVASRMRPMTMKESAGLHAWIKHGLAAAATTDGTPAAGVLEAAEVPAVSSLSVVGNSPRHVNRQLDYAMLYCPSMQHVLLGGDVEDAEAKYQPSAPRVIPAAERRTLDDIDDSVPPLAEQGFASSRVERRDVVAGSADLLVPTQAGESTSLLVNQRPRPKMSLYSPVVAREGAADDDILAPWEEYAKVDTPIGGRQKYLRIDVEVVGSRWVTADKFAGGLY
ncbi:hypothetical protein IW152_001749 [Coemansia sp. BCRC 34962]|nr:hypothetical protein IW152_001749 [Coemansia sp. BCRC 34962]